MGYQTDQTGVIPDVYTDRIIDSCPVAQLTWVPALDTALRPVTEGVSSGSCRGGASSGLDAPLV